MHELNQLYVEEQEVDQALLDAKKNFEDITENQDFKDYGYVSFDDIRSLTNGNDINLIAVKAPSGTSLDIPDPDQICLLHEQVRKVRKH